MPQLDIANALPQILWLALVFAILYLAVRGLLPRVEQVVESRKARIAADLREAEAARDAAEAASSGGSSALAEARARAVGLTSAARDRANALVAARIAAVDAELKARAEAAAQRLAAQRDAAAAELEQLAALATVDLVGRVAGLEVSSDEAAAAVRKVAA
jgi:F-type H+-transporting ATPase subunit b